MIFKSNKSKQIRKILTREIAKLSQLYTRYENDYRKQIEENLDFSLIRPYLYLWNDYALDIVLLVKMRRYNSIMPLMRIFVECYSDLKHMLSSYRDAGVRSFEEEIRLINAATLEQLRREMDALSKDRSINDEQKELIIRNRLDNMKELIAEFFPERKNEINQEDEKYSIIEIIKSIKKEYKLPILKPDRVNEALSFSLAKDIDSNLLNGIESLYVNMCSASHNNVHTVINRVVSVGKEGNALVANKDSEIIDAILHAMCVCMRDISEELYSIQKEGLL